jgi:hypothetical protein
VTSNEIARDTHAAKGNAERRTPIQGKRDGCAPFEVCMHRNRLMMLASIVLTSDDASVTIAAT